ncbi:putative membrane protein [Pseudovibrio denitrificans]|uniref:Putative membrane protein n=1 Tax=Pseudovibrio denitrificans TaxID=258256 RepID=A0A1I7DBQ4_9HYPH|nr:SHOCT domain-containing protein [Pseudovibrio denitrificans]SFU09054.1 putative membrane protein [Pseudovibrio denitrificans]
MFHQAGMHGFHFFPFPIVLILLLIIGFLIARSYGYFAGSSPAKTTEPEQAKSSNSEALDILSRRFAKGEIDEEEYQKRSQVLRLNL